MLVMGILLVMKAEGGTHGARRRRCGHRLLRPAADRALFFAAREGRFVATFFRTDARRGTGTAATPSISRSMFGCASSGTATRVRAGGLSGSKVRVEISLR